MGVKIFMWGITVLLAFPALFPAFPNISFFGALITVAGAILVTFDK